MQLFKCETIAQFKIGMWLADEGIVRDDILSAELVAPDILLHRKELDCVLHSILGVGIRARIPPLGTECPFAMLVEAVSVSGQIAPQVFPVKVHHGEDGDFPVASTVHGGERDSVSPGVVSGENDILKIYLDLTDVLSDFDEGAGVAAERLTQTGCVPSRSRIRQGSIW